MVTRTLHQVAATLALLACAAPAAAQQAEPPAEAAPSEKTAESKPEAAPATPTIATPARPRVHHAPVTVATEAEPIVIEATFEHPELIRSAAVVFQPQGGAPGIAEFQRGAATYVATIPADAVRAPGIGYAIEIERLDGGRVAAYGTRATPSRILVTPDRAAARKSAILGRLGGNSSVASASAEYVGFGLTRGTTALPCAAGIEDCPAGTRRTPEVNDQYYRVEVAYTHRPLTTVSEFSLRGGVIRGTSLVPTETLDPDKYKVGINYGAPTVTFRMSDSWHLETELLTSITEVGFSVGAGGALLIGDPYGSKLTLGFETIGLDPDTYFGSRFYSRMDIAASDRVTIAPIIEVTDMPHADVYGVRLLAAGSVDLGRGFGVSARGGYQARKSTSGGASFGAGLSLAF